MKNSQKLNYDLVVIGSGPGGIGAAIAAGKAGLKTALIEKNAYVGGNMQIGLNIHGFEDMNGRRIIGGNSWELIQRCIEFGGSVGTVKLKGAHIYSDTPIDLAILEACALEMLEEAQVDIWLHTYALEPIIINNKITELKTWSKSGKISFFADNYIDSTGDADIAYSAGVPIVNGREKDGFMQPMSLVITMAPVRIRELVKKLGLGYGSAIKPYCENEDYIWFALNFKKWQEEISNIGIELGKEGVFWGNSIHPKIVNLNAIKILKKSGVNTKELSDAEVKARKAAIKFGEFLRNNIPSFSEAYIVRIAPHIGVRETRRIIGDYVLSRKDAVAGNIPEDTIALCGYPIDIHDPIDGVAEFTDIGKGRFGIPYRALIPQKINNLLVNGRAISATHVAIAATRVMATCLAIGEACGTAAAIAKEKNISVSELNGIEVRKVLELKGTIIF